MRRLVPALLAASATFAAAAPSGLDVTIANGDVVRGTLLPASETETFRVDCPAGAKLSAVLQSGPARSKVVVRLLDPSGAELASSGGRAARLRGRVIATSGEHRLVVQSQDGVTSDDYRLAVSWTDPRRLAQTVAVGANATAEFRFAAEAGADVSLRLAPRRRSHASPAAVRIVGLEGSDAELAGGAVAAFHAPATDTYTLTFENGAAVAGDVRVSAKVRTPRHGRRLLSATSRDIPPGTTVLAAAVLDGAGGRVDAPSPSVLAGTSVTIPASALAVPTIVVLGTAGALTPPKPAESVAATPTAFAGPFLRSFPGPSRPRVTLSYASGPAPPAKSGLRVFAADAAGVAQEVTPAILDAPSRSISFDAASFTRFQGFFVQQPDVTPPFLLADTNAEDFGASVAVSGSFVYAGAPSAAGTGGELQAGAVRILEHVGTTWVERARIEDPSPEADDRFGGSISLARGTDGLLRLFVPVPRKTEQGYPQQGVIHVFVGSGAAWALESSLTPPPSDSLPGSLGTWGRFGEAITPWPGLTVAPDGDSFVASGTSRYEESGGAYSYGSGNTSHYICSRHAGGWTIDSHDWQFVPQGIRGSEWIVVWPNDPRSAHAETIDVFAGPSYFDAGGAFVPVQAIAEPNSGPGYTDFGAHLVVDGDTIATSTAGPGNNGRMWFGSRGAAGWSIDQHVDPLVTSDPAWQGTPASIALQGDTAVATAANQASATVYRRDGGAWSEALRLDPTATLSGTHNDSHVALDGHVVVIGARNGPAATRGIAIYLLPW